MLRYFLLPLILIFPALVQAQAPSTNPSSRLEILFADRLSFTEKSEVPVQKLIGDVQIKQDSTYFYCDSAYSYV
ncbi:MAG: OstA-like protein, partial [Bacteroidota bacterium]